MLGVEVMIDYFIAGGKYTKDFILSANATILLIISFPEIFTIIDQFPLQNIPVITSSIYTMTLKILFIILGSFISGMIRYKSVHNVPFVIGSSVDTLKILKANMGWRYRKVNIDKFDSLLGTKTALTEDNLYLVRIPNENPYKKVYDLINQTWYKLKILQEYLFGTENTVMHIYIDNETPIPVSFALGLFLGKSHQKYIVWDFSKKKMKKVWQSRPSPSQYKEKIEFFAIVHHFQTNQTTTVDIEDLPDLVKEFGIKYPVIFINITESLARKDFNIKQTCPNADAWIEIKSSKSDQWLPSKDVKEISSAAFIKISTIFEQILETTKSTLYLALKVPHPVSIALAQRLYHFGNLIVLLWTGSEHHPYYIAYTVEKLLNSVPCLTPN